MALSICRSRRGVARRDHAFPPPDVPPSVVVTARAARRPAERGSCAAAGIAVVTRAGQSLGPVDIKTSACCPTCWPQAAERPAPTMPGSSIATAWSRKALRPMPGSSTQDGQAGHPPGRSWHSARHYPHGAVRCQPGAGLSVEERAFTLAEANAAREAFITRQPDRLAVVRIDGRPSARATRPCGDRPAARIS